MTKELCIVHANCQGEPLVERLMACPEFAAQYDCRLFTNYVREPVPDDVLGRCSLFLHQYLGPKWNELASDVLIGKLPANARHLCVPNMFFTGYWPMWSGAGGFNYRCTHLDSYIDMGLSPEETVMLFLRSDVQSKYDLPGLVEASLKRERERESHTPIKYVHVIEEEFGSRRLYNTVNHPGPRLMNHAAKGILEHLGMTPPPAEAFDALGDPFPEFEQPINPKVGAFFGWDFATPETKYNIYGRKMTYARYVANYVEARSKGVTDFIGYLQGEYLDS
ncbi:WcbI family polysaccharide biosynthesis putative acetyltransferase [Pseudodesulfovibrio sp. zrk46]|uniref:WcbI family polysaccharide biosynthesis putative acetyltransferase n=1 Tax=Pseudodesulfovibrio sp. zrk46 TaxID=2725288 RepID=UPI00144A0223|nr:WcbI family polysaccharide biosynthesis putative acetyltransferase [Pseudodesulfovibrio sp. zrk46]QJB55444.1 hypothetical protein HFN16_03125 [Pseudodesulfovibrio sp. zrk46]